MAKHAFGNYGETLEEGTLRPFFAAPQSIYGLANIVGEGYTGVGITGYHRFGSWALSYDAYAGELDVETSPALDRILAPDVDPAEEIVFETRELIGGRLNLETPIDGLVARVSAYTGVEAPSELETGSRHTAMALSGEYLTEALSLRAEYAHMLEKSKAMGNTRLARKLEAKIRSRLPASTSRSETSSPGPPSRARPSTEPNMAASAPRSSASSRAVVVEMPSGSSSGVSASRPRRSSTGMTRVRDGSTAASTAEVAAPAARGALEPFSRGATSRQRTRASSASCRTSPPPTLGPGPPRPAAQPAAVSSASAAGERWWRVRAIGPWYQGCAPAGPPSGLAR